MNDPIITVSVWRGPQSALAARLGIEPSHMVALIHRRGLRRGGGWELQVTSPAAMQTLKHSLRVADELD